MRPSCLFSTAFRKHSVPQWEIVHRHADLPYHPLILLLGLIFHLPFSWRKLLLNLCRVQAHPYTNDRISQDIASVQQAILIPTSRGDIPLTIHTVIDYTLEFYDDPFACSVLSYFVRAESTAYPAEFEEVLEETKTKEISAALLPNSKGQILDYRCLFTKDVDFALNPAITGRTRRLTILIREHIRRLEQTPSSFLGPILFPQYNGRKSTSYETQREYLRSLTLDPSTGLEPIHITTLDLLRHYFRFGIVIGGPIEVRVAWKFNDLKPRVYYCLGGDSYWQSLYIKPICNYLAQALPSTNPATRYDVTRISCLQSGDILITYDYTSFTTSLEELKYYLFHLGTALHGVEITVLDVRGGLQQIDVGEYIHDYNEFINVHQAFDLSRLSGQPGVEIHYQGRSGSLGVPGNIVFSTSLHGVNLASLTGTPDSDSCVGDDALANVPFVLLAIIIEGVRSLGFIEESKFTTIARPSYDDPPDIIQRTQFKYLKRPLNVHHEGGIIQGFLDFFPNLAEIYFPCGDGIHTSSEKDLETTARTFCMQWGRFLTRYAPYFPFAVDAILEIIVQAIEGVYDRLGLPVDGGIPSHFFYYNAETNVKVEGEFFVPPCDSISVFGQSWIQLLYSRYAGQLMTVPCRVGGPIDPPIDLFPGLSFRATGEGPLLRMLVALELATEEMILETIEFDEMFANKFEMMLSGDVDEPMLKEYRVIEVPSWYLDCYLLLYPQPLNDRPYEEVVEELSSIISLE